MAERKRQANQVGGRPVRKVLTLTDAEHAELSIAAQREGKTVQRFVVEAGIARVRGVDLEQTKETIRGLFAVQHQVAKVGTNINQLAHHANATGELLGAQLLEELRQLRVVLDRVDSVVDQVSLEARRG